MQNKRKDKLYACWCHMKSRCYNPNNKDYQYYGAKGIKICDEWKNSYDKFKEWSIHNGYELGLEIDRINGNKDYCPENCRWATRKEQMNNVSFNHLLTLNGVTKTMAEWAEDTGLTYNTIKQRINKLGWNIEKAITTPQRKFGNTEAPLGDGITLAGKVFMLTYNGETLSSKQWSDRLGYNKGCITRRIKKGWSAKQCIETPRRGD